jgi:hypothetical protein
LSRLTSSFAVGGASSLRATAVAVPAGAREVEPGTAGERYNKQIPGPAHSSRCCPYQVLAADIGATVAAAVGMVVVEDKFEADAEQVAVEPHRLVVAAPARIASHIALADRQASGAAVMVVVLRYPRTLGSMK